MSAQSAVGANISEVYSTPQRGNGKRAGHKKEARSLHNYYKLVKLSTVLHLD